MWWPTGEVLFMRPDGTHVDSLWFKLERAARRGIVTARRGRGGEDLWRVKLRAQPIIGELVQKNL